MLRKVTSSHLSCQGKSSPQIYKELSTDYTTRIKFVKCDVTNWDDQVNLFRTAASMTPLGTIEHVIANAGIAIDDEVFSYDGTLLPHNAPTYRD